MRSVLAVAVTVAAAVCASLGTARALETQIQPNYTSMSMSAGNNGDLAVVSWLVPAGGMTAVCGLYYPEKPSSALEARISKLLQNLTF